jgi:hypothetical protein
MYGMSSLAFGVHTLCVASLTLKEHRALLRDLTPNPSPLEGGSLRQNTALALFIQMNYEIPGE